MAAPREGPNDVSDVIHVSDVSAAAQARGETELQRLDQNFDELLQELRVAQTGVQLLFAFLLTLPFTPVFADLTDAQRTLYLVTLCAAALASAVLIAPVAFHRWLFRRRRKHELVDTASRAAIAGLLLLLVAFVSGVAMILDVVVGGWWAVAGAGVLAVAFLLLWVVLPLRARPRER